jgi:hypothetical protein
VAGLGPEPVHRRQPQARLRLGEALITRAQTRQQLERGSALLDAVATALKRAQLGWAAEHGYSQLVTEMAADNAPIRALNERLGYRPLPASIVVSGSVS